MLCSWHCQCSASPVLRYFGLVYWGQIPGRTENTRRCCAPTADCTCSAQCRGTFSCKMLGTRNFGSVRAPAAISGPQGTAKHNAHPTLGSYFTSMPTAPCSQSIRPGPKLRNNHFGVCNYKRCPPPPPPLLSEFCAIRVLLLSFHRAFDHRSQHCLPVPPDECVPDRP